MTDNRPRITDQEALDLHSSGRPGKFEIKLTKNLNDARDLSLAYSPGVAVPCLAIEKDPSKIYEYTNKGNVVGVISNGTAVLGLGNLGPAGSKPVMEGKAVLFKRFADIDGIDLEVDTEKPEEFINCVKFLGTAFGGINLEDIKAPECFEIEACLSELMDIPVFHDDQHGTAIIASAGLLNGLHLTGRDIKKTRMVILGAGAAAIACAHMFVAVGLPKENIIMLDSKGVINARRTDSNKWKKIFAADHPENTLEEAMKGADVFVGLSGKNTLPKEFVATMNDDPIIFAMANPDPEIKPEDVASVRSDAIMATGRSDYPNQINNVLGFPYIFRGALDVRATKVNEEMKLAAAQALAELAREPVPEEIVKLHNRDSMKFGREYIIPTPFDPRLITRIPAAVAQAAMDSGVAQKPIADMDAYKEELAGRLK